MWNLGPYFFTHITKNTEKDESDSITYFNVEKERNKRVLWKWKLWIINFLIIIRLYLFKH